MPFALYLQGRLAASRGAWQEAGRLMLRVTAEFPAAEAVADARVSGWPNPGTSWAITTRPGRWCRRQPQATAIWTALLPLRRCQILAVRHQWTEALAAAEAILEQHPDFCRSYEVEYVAGRSLMALARLDEARTAFQRVVDDPRASTTEVAAVAQWMIGETYLHQRQYRQAIRAYSQVEKQCDDDRWQAAALRQMGVCYQRLQEPHQSASNPSTTDARVSAA